MTPSRLRGILILEYFIIIGGFVLLGAFAGLMAGLLGIGGGLVVVPGLAFLYQFTPVPHEYVMQMAAGTSLAISVSKDEDKCTYSCKGNNTFSSNVNELNKALF